MDDVRGLFLGMPHSTTPAAVTTKKGTIMTLYKFGQSVYEQTLWTQIRLLLV